MDRKPVIIDLNYHHHVGVSDYSLLIKERASSYGHFRFLKEWVDLTVIRLTEVEKKCTIDDVNYEFRKGRSSKLWLPFGLHRRINSLHPDVIFIHGFDFPLQVLLLRVQTRAKLVIQYHGGGKPAGLTGLVQKIVKLFVTDYVFTAKEQSKSFTNKGLISSDSHIHEILEGSTNKQQVDKMMARKQLKIPTEHVVFLWVGRLIENKDPLTVLNGLKKCLLANPGSVLLMIYQDETLLPEIKTFLLGEKHLSERIKLAGEVAHDGLDYYYSAADYFVSGSFYEGSGYSLFEAMACGCIPLVTDIPSFRVMTNKGKLGAVWKPGDTSSLEEALEKVLAKNKVEESKAVKNFFEKELSFESIAKKQATLFTSLAGTNNRK